MVFKINLFKCFFKQYQNCVLITVFVDDLYTICNQTSHALFCMENGWNRCLFRSVLLCLKIKFWMITSFYLIVVCNCVHLSSIVEFHKVTVQVLFIPQSHRRPNPDRHETELFGDVEETFASGLVSKWYRNCWSLVEVQFGLRQIIEVLAGTCRNRDGDGSGNAGRIRCGFHLVSGWKFGLSSVLMRFGFGRTETARKLNGNVVHKWCPQLHRYQTESRPNSLRAMRAYPVFWNGSICWTYLHIIFTRKI